MAKLLLQTLISCTIVGVLLFVPAGTLEWPGAWLLIGEIAIGSLLLGLWLLRANPGLLEERLRSPIQANQKHWDKALLLVLVLVFVGWAVLMAFDVVRSGWSRMPVVLQAVGALGPIASYVITWQAFRANSFASPVVKIANRAQIVAESGPYAWVRHPMYAGALLFFLGTPLLLGSWWGLAAIPLLSTILAIRAIAEERELEAGLPGYSRYLHRVRYRLVPGIW